jgi:hypothetical protein
MMNFRVGQVANLRPIGNRPGQVRNKVEEADCQSAAGYHPAPHGSRKLGQGSEVEE